MSERKLDEPMIVADQIIDICPDGEMYPIEAIGEIITADRRSTIEAVLGECPTCKGSGQKKYVLGPDVHNITGMKPGDIMDAPCFHCSWLRAFAAREGLMEVKP